MNGTIFDEIKKQDNSKKKEKLKFIVAIASTNLLVAVLCLSFGHEAVENAHPTTSSHLLHPHFKMVVAPLTVLADFDSEATETPVTLMNKSKKIIIQKAYLHDEVTSTSSKELGSAPHFKIEIPEDEIIKLSADEGELMIAMPEIKIPKKETKPLNKRVSKYEVSL